LFWCFLLVLKVILWIISIHSSSNRKWLIIFVENKIPNLVLILTFFKQQPFNSNCDWSILASSFGKLFIKTSCSTETSLSLYVCPSVCLYLSVCLSFSFYSLFFLSFILVAFVYQFDHFLLIPYSFFSFFLFLSFFVSLVLFFMILFLFILPTISISFVSILSSSFYLEFPMSLFLMFIQNSFSSLSLCCFHMSKLLSVTFLLLLTECMMSYASASARIE
jgi:hypothetical protein